MFTGIIEGIGKVKSVSLSSNGGIISIRSCFCIKDLMIGDSISVNGACLTATKIEDNFFNVDVSPETIDKTVLGRLKIGESVNLERALKFSGRLDGHLVLGHIDGTSLIRKKKIVGNTTVITFSVTEHLSKYILKKGSIAVDGISLTINSSNETSFSVSVIPQTLKTTTLDTKKTGSWVNVETDIVGKYIEQFMRTSLKLIGKNNIEQENVNMAFLSKNGFI